MVISFEKADVETMQDSIYDRTSSTWSRETSVTTSPTEGFSIDSLDASFHDPDAQSIRREQRAVHAHEYNVSTRKKYLYLGLYFALNLTLTIFNKAVLRTVSGTSGSDSFISNDAQADQRSPSLLFHGC